MVLAAMAIEREQLGNALEMQAKLIEVGERTPELLYNAGLLPLLPASGAGTVPG